MSRLTVKQLLEDGGKSLELSLVDGSDGLWHDLSDSRYFKAGLLLTGLEINKGKHGIVILGFTEISFLSNLPDNEKLFQACTTLLETEPACIIITKNQEIPTLLKKMSLEASIPLLTTPKKTGDFLDCLDSFIDEYTKEITRMHGVLVEVLGIGVFLTGPSGIGKSEAALELVTRGHRLVADDTVEIQKHHPDVLEGRGTPIIKHHMEIRGLGIINVPFLFGPASVRDRKKIEIAIQLEEWDGTKEYERLGSDEKHLEILGIKIPLIILPVRPGRSLGTIIEVAARDQLLKQRGINSFQMFQEKLNEALINHVPEAVIEQDIE
ncbi:HPr(Ser) kinase/phosphatase [Myxococcota bacterium]|nr:HPr(Ser) kinase/phosphatase [Myxococcota bacterium]MBU1381693.1 HPr(Ser) kinase/phosphatase [Myxococcota bacterium]MBU1497351.1 HPr(Ser) kinase/phosphatase [Myxococcota bacterium]